MATGIIGRLLTYCAEKFYVPVPADQDVVFTPRDQFRSYFYYGAVGGNPYHYALSLVTAAASSTGDRTIIPIVNKTGNPPYIISAKGNAITIRGVFGGSGVFIEIV